MIPFTSSEGAAEPEPMVVGEDGSRTDRPVVTVLLFAAAREAAGTGRIRLAAATVGEVVDVLRARHGEHFAAVLDRSKVWLNGEPAGRSDPLATGDEVAVLPPVSGGQG